jgi:hypothetical protein
MKTKIVLLVFWFILLALTIVDAGKMPGSAPIVPH